MNTRRYPRTLQEAFGPYCGHHITEPKPLHPHDRLVIRASVLAAVALAVILITGAIA
jgi:hypothetical protein